MNEKIEDKMTALMTIKATPAKLKDIVSFITENHSWGDPCIEVIPLMVDQC